MLEAAALERSSHHSLFSTTVRITSHQLSAAFVNSATFSVVLMCYSLPCPTVHAGRPYSWRSAGHLGRLSSFSARTPPKSSTPAASG